MAEAPASPEQKESTPPPRRQFLGWLTGGIVAGIAAAIGIPGVRALVGSTLSRRGPDTVAIGKIADYPLGQPRLAEFTVTRTDGWFRSLESRGVWVVRTAEQEATVFNGRCTHLGCAYSWKTEGAQSDHFLCPCHDGVYTLDGKVVSGPPPRSLDTLPVQIKDGVLVVEYQDFRLGVSEKAPA